MQSEKIPDRLKAAGIESYIFEARIIAEHVKKNNLSPLEREDKIRRRESREPLQYILGEWEFYGDVYKLNKDCLIPRPETEFLTEYIIKNAPAGGRVVDLCSGSGCVSISAVKRRADLFAVLIDISGGAAEISKENAKLNGVSGRAEFYAADIAADFEKIVKEVKSADMIVSNPPYLTRAELERINSEKTELSHEPKAAFFGGEDGLDFYRVIIDKYSPAFGDDTITAVECGINQSQSIIKMFEKIGFSCEVIRDYAKIERVVAGKKIIK
jgi:release factor glutamine methyltransferase